MSEFPYPVGVVSHTKREIPQKTDGSVSNAPLRMPQQPDYDWNTTEFSVKKKNLEKLYINWFKLFSTNTTTFMTQSAHLGDFCVKFVLNYMFICSKF